MSTRSRIGYVNDDGKIVSVYCHWDGYPSHNGEILLEHYNTAVKVKKLVNGGDMSSLCEKCSKPKGHSFDSPVKGYTIYYGRDRGEKDVEPQTVDDEYSFLNLIDDGAEFAYLFKGGKWEFAELYDNPKLKALTKAACSKN